jgi:hypothetical protein
LVHYTPVFLTPPNNHPLELWLLSHSGHNVL